MIDGDGAAPGQEAARRLEVRRRDEIRPGLTGVELARVAAEFGFEFADDHRGEGLVRH